MATVESKTSIKIDQLINDTVISGSIDPGSGHLILTTRGGASIDAGAVVKPFGLPWSSTATYQNGDIVGYNGEVWKATGTSTNKPPTLYGSLWSRLTGKDADWVERNPYFSSDLLSESWQLFWKTGTVNSSLDTVAGEFESGIQSLKLDMAASSMQRMYIKEENIVEGGDYVTATVRAKLVSAASGVTINAELLQNNASGKPEPFETGLSTTASAEGAQTVTTSWQTFTFTCLAANAKPRANMNVYATTGANAAVVLIDQIRLYRGKGPALSKPVADTLYLPKYQEYDSGWIYVGSGAPGAPAFQNGSGPYTPYGSNHAIPRFRRIGDIIWMEGLVANPPAGYGVIFQLPAGFRPAASIVPVGVGNGTTEGHACQVLGNGNVVSGTNVSGWTSISCHFVASDAAVTWHNLGAAGEPAFGAGWSNYSPGSWQIGRFCKIGEYVYLDGMIQRTTGSVTTIFTLPAGNYPLDGNTHTPIAAQATGIGGTDFGVNISTAGVVTCRASAAQTGWLSLSGIRIYVGAANDVKWKRFRGGAEGWFAIQGPYGAGWPYPGIRRDGKIVHLDGLANFGSTGICAKLPHGYAPGQQLILPVVNGTNRRVDITGPNDDWALNGLNSIMNSATGVNGWTTSWVVSEAYENDIRWNT